MRMTFSGWFDPVMLRESAKFGRRGGCTAESLRSWDLPERTKQTVEELGNFGLSQKTWSSYKTAKRMWELCKDETNQDLTLPWTQRETLIFIFIFIFKKIQGPTNINLKKFFFEKCIL